MGYHHCSSRCRSHQISSLFLFSLFFCCCFRLFLPLQSSKMHLWGIDGRLGILRSSNLWTTVGHLLCAPVLRLVGSGSSTEQSFCDLINRLTRVLFNNPNNPNLPTLSKSNESKHPLREASASASSRLDGFKALGRFSNTWVPKTSYPPTDMFQSFLFKHFCSFGPRTSNVFSI